MFAEWIAIGARTVAVGAVLAAMIALFTVVPIPNPDYTVFSQMIGKGYAIMTHWVPAFPAIYSFIIVVLGFWLTLKVFKLSIAGLAFVLKVMKP